MNVTGNLQSTSANPVPQGPSVERVKPGLYKVTGESGIEAGYIQSYKGGWMLHMASMPKEDFHYLRDAQIEAMKRAERY